MWKISLLYREHIFFTEIQKVAAFKSYRISKFEKLVGFLIKNDAKIEFWYFYAFLNYFCIILQSNLILWNSVCLFVSMLVRNRLPNHAYYGDEAFAGDSVGLGLGQRLDFIF